MDIPSINIPEEIMKDPFHYLDAVLNLIVANQQNQLGLQKLLDDEEINIPDNVLKIIMDKLIKEGYVKPEATITFKIYKITFEGLLFQKQGGYTQMEYNNNLLKRQEESNKRTQTILFWFTGIVAVGTLIEAIYYIKELCLPK